MLKQRAFTATVMLLLFIGALLLAPGLAWAILTGVVVLVAADEWAHLSGFGKKGARGYVGATLLLAVAVMLIPGMPLTAEAESAPQHLFYWIAVAFWALVAPFWLRVRWKSGPAVMAVTGWVVLLPTWIALVQLQIEAPYNLLKFLGIIWIADTFAYIAGKRFGKHKLAPSISPGKTWEGVAGAFAGVTVYGAILLALARPAEISASSLLLSLAALWVITALSVVGDLYESMLKRQRGVKDSGTLLPGHGGVLDRIDGLTATLPFAGLAIMLLP